jgi:DNA-directed RNA polymerase subunit RPC12/RpoP
MVPWNRRRVGRTAVATVLSVAGGVAVAYGCRAINRQVPPPIAVLLGGGTVPITWVLSTVLVWRETAAERLARLTAQGMPVIACPLCGYNLAGLTEARCPECGGRFTLEQVMLARPRTGAQPAEL